MSENKKAFATYRPYHKIIEGIGGKILHAVGIGTIIGSIVSNSISYPITLHEVLYIPELGCNLLSTTKLRRFGNITMGSETTSFHVGENSPAITVHTPSNLLLIHMVLADSAFAADTATASIWHSRMGHASSSRMKATSRATSNNITTNIWEYDCKDDVCVRAKLSRSNIPRTRDHPTSKPFELIHSDLMEWDVRSNGGFKYVLSLLEDYSKVVWIVLLKSKADVAIQYKRFIEMVKTQFGTTIKAIQTDMGTEFVNKQLERYNRTLKEMANSLRFAAKLSSSCKTPYEFLYGHPPDISHLRVFGCIAYYKDHHTKMSDPVGIPAMFLGYQGNGDGRIIKGYRLYDFNRRRLVFSRDVVFQESVMYLDRFPSIETNAALQSSNGTFEIISSSEEVTHSEHPDLVGEESESEDDNNSLIPPPSLVLSEIPEEHEVDGDPDEEAIPIISAPPQRTSHRCRKSNQDPAYFYPSQGKTASERISQTLASSINLPKTYKQAIKMEESLCWMGAMMSEKTSLDVNQTWELTPRPTNQTVIPVRWVYAVKSDKNGLIDRFKARVVAKGYAQIEGNSIISMSTPLSVLLNNEIDTDVYIEQPEGFVDPEFPNHVLKLKKAIYGLKQAPRLWSETYASALKRVGYTQVQSDSCIFVRRSKHGSVYLEVFVDDTLVAAPKECITSIKHELMSLFSMKDLGEAEYFLGMEIQRDRVARTITITQRKYIQDMLEKFHFAEWNPSPLPVTMHEKIASRGPQEPPCDNNLYRSMVGSLLYASNMTRPDIATPVALAGQYVVDPAERHLVAVKKILRYLAGTKDHGLVLGGRTAPLELSAFVDADYNNDVDDRRSRSGVLVFLGNSPIIWSSRKQHCNVISTTEAEIPATNCNFNLRG
ncbi:DNA-directed DNA polymerase [Synchytrium endobioticum]|uniref:DNA-directed DNA polymerase n=1 Tax=Synchytrium endobioticum TaxID=286115 RepID=A0A507DAM3_9FUNG|nr:DNA-directed DNA polymerase [Synchytrium endobioticum]